MLVKSMSLIDRDFQGLESKPGLNHVIFNQVFEQGIERTFLKHSFKTCIWCCNKAAYNSVGAVPEEKSVLVCKSAVKKNA